LLVDGRNGWIIGDRSFGTRREETSDALFALLEKTIVAEFHERGPDGVPARWVDGIKRSLASLAWQVGSGPMVRAYQRIYREAARPGRDGTRC